uniref:Uncharacterized protein n=1 Tax=Agarophyton chilense TaxID=2510777 RepID=O49031_AGACH|nr:ORF9 [Agarophyton chilense]
MDFILFNKTCNEPRINLLKKSKYKFFYFFTNRFSNLFTRRFFNRYFCTCPSSSSKQYKKDQELIDKFIQN